MSRFYNDSIFWVELDKIKPNPFQPMDTNTDVMLAIVATVIHPR